jgi:signal transduction histidine kinase
MNIFIPSLTQRMVIGQLIAVVGFSLLLACNLLWEFSKHDEGELDKQLFYSAKATALTVHGESATPQETNLVLRALDRVTREAVGLIKQEKGSDPASGAYAMRVTDLSGREVYVTQGYDNLPLNAQATSAYSFNHSGQRWRGLNYRASEQNMVVQIAQRTDYIDAELWSLVKTYIVWPLLWFLPLASLASWLVVARGLLPLRALSERIARRTHNDLSPLDFVAVHAETQPLVYEINSLLRKLETTLSRERNFLIDAAHELRTPLAVIQAQVHVLRHASGEAEKANASDELNVGVARTASLIQKLLLTAKVSAENFAPRLENIDLSAFVQERMATLSVLAAQKSIDIELDAPPACWVRIDRETFVSAVDNVLDNAIRYTPEGGRIQVHIALLGTDKVRLRIDDNGAGIAPDLYERVFERFYRVGGTEQQGSGLGLAIVKRVLALHGGEVALSPGLSQRGLSVALTLPTGA